jgi:hypothetical protein
MAPSVLALLRRLILEGRFTSLARRLFNLMERPAGGSGEWVAFWAFLL